MKRLFWLGTGMVLGAWMYRYFREEGGQVPGFESLGESGRRLTERGREFADSGRHFAASGRQLMDEGRQFAQTAMGTAQSRGREVVDTVKTQAGKLQSADVGRLAEHTREAAREAGQTAQRHARSMAEESKQSGGPTPEQAKAHGKALKDELRGTAERLREDVQHEVGSSPV